MSSSLEPSLPVPPILVPPKLADLPSTLDFSLFPLRFQFTPRATLGIPKGNAANLFRGFLGNALHAMAHPPFAESVYTRLFEPGQHESSPAGLRNPPRPYVIRASHLHGKRIQAGEPFFIDLHLFKTGVQAAQLIESLVLAFGTVAHQGIGEDRVRCDLTGVIRIDDAKAALASHPLCLSLQSPSTPCGRIEVEFRTPAELKSAGVVATAPEFAILFRRARDRVATLRALYGAGPIRTDFRELGKRAASITLLSHTLIYMHAQRRSSRTHQVHTLGGYLGRAEYGGIATEFLPWLKAAEWTGVGRQTVWGKGEIQVQAFEK